jgi:hypothetical protein
LHIRNVFATKKHTWTKTKNSQIYKDENVGSVGMRIDEEYSLKRGMGTRM